MFFHFAPFRNPPSRPFVPSSTEVKKIACVTAIHHSHSPASLNHRGSCSSEPKSDSASPPISCSQSLSAVVLSSLYCISFKLPLLQPTVIRTSLSAASFVYVSGGPLRDAMSHRDAVRGSTATRINRQDESFQRQGDEKWLATSQAFHK